VTLKARLQPTHRADLEDAFDEEMKKRGVHVTGGGTAFSENGEVSECNIQLEIEHFSDQVVEQITGMFEAMLAPKGSKLTVHDKEISIFFGKVEGLALYLNGTDLPDEIYEKYDSNFVYDECERLLDEKDLGSIHSRWDGAEETALYMYGDSFEAMKNAIEPFVNTYPLCQKARIVKITD
jgi:hypothetical protein